MVFIAGDNDLDGFGQQYIEEILAVKGGNEELTVFVQYDYSSHDIGETNTGTVNTLSSFIEWGTSNRLGL